MTSFAPVPGHGFIACSDGYLLGPRTQRIPNVDKYGYERVSAHRRGSSDGQWQTYSLPVHVAVALAFHGPRPEGTQVRHVDGHQQNNRADNLAYGTPSENGEDKRRHGSAAGERNGRSKLTDAQRREIRDTPKTYGSGRALAARFGVSEEHVSTLRKGN
jgi:hypothetical protein